MSRKDVGKPVLRIVYDKQSTRVDIVVSYRSRNSGLIVSSDRIDEEMIVSETPENKLPLFLQ